MPTEAIQTYSQLFSSSGTKQKSLRRKELLASSLKQELIKGLTADNKYISSKFFYDKYGSLLFEWITQLPEYYPTRTEKSLLKKYAPKLFGQLSHVNLIELGSGDCSKISLVLNSIQKQKLKNIRYYPIDFSQSSIDNLKTNLNKTFGNLTIKGISGDFTKLTSLPNELPRIICFFGSTIGNFDSLEAEKLLIRIQEIMNPGDQLIVGLDMVKNQNILEAAYNDSQRITEAFNKNILRACNHLLETDFVCSDFQHVAFFNDDLKRIEMHLEAKHNLHISSPHLNQYITIYKGERIHTENSHKFNMEMIQSLANKSKLTIKQIFSDEKKWFSLVQFIK